MRNGLYSIHIHMLDGVRGRDSGVLILRDGELVGGGPYFWSVGRYSVGDGTWKGELVTNQHTPFEDPFVRPLSRAGGLEVPANFRHFPSVRHHPGGHAQPQFSRGRSGWLDAFIKSSDPADELA